MEDNLQIDPHKQIEAWIHFTSREYSSFLSHLIINIFVLKFLKHKTPLELRESILFI